MPESNLPMMAGWAGLSLMIHVGVIVALGMFQLTSTAYPVPEKITVQLLEVPQVAPPQEVESTEETPSVTPKMKAIPRTMVSKPLSRTVNSTKVLPMPMAQPELKVASPTRPPQTSMPEPRTRRLLVDNRASNALQAQDFSKMIPARASTKVRSSQEASSSHRQLSLGTSALSTASVSIRPAESLQQDTSMAKAATPSRKTLAMVLPNKTGKIGKTGAKLARSTPPIYPRLARKEGWEGTVVLRVQLRIDGIPEQVSVKQTSGHDVLDQAAVKAVSRWIFYPAKDGNIPFASLVDVPIRFDLTKS